MTESLAHADAKHDLYWSLRTDDLQVDMERKIGRARPDLLTENLSAILKTTLEQATTLEIQYRIQKHKKNRGERIRTSDVRIPNAARCQTALHPEKMGLDRLELPASCLSDRRTNQLCYSPMKHHNKKKGGESFQLAALFQGKKIQRRAMSPL